MGRPGKQGRFSVSGAQHQLLRATTGVDAGYCGWRYGVRQYGCPPPSSVTQAGGLGNEAQTKHVAAGRIRRHLHYDM